MLKIIKEVAGYFFRNPILTIEFLRSSLPPTTARFTKTRPQQGSDDSGIDIYRIIDADVNEEKTILACQFVVAWSDLKYFRLEQNPGVFSLLNIVLT